MKFNRKCGLTSATEDLIRDLDFLDLSVEEEAEKEAQQKKNPTKEDEEPNFLDF